MNDLHLPAIMADPSTPISMSSREIAELTRKRHDNVKRDIEAMLNDLEIDALKSEDISKAAEMQAQGCWMTSYLDSMNRQQAEYHLDRDLTMTLITGYNAKLRYRVVVRVRELEEQAARASFIANQPPYRFRASTGRPELDDQLNLIQAVSERLPINNEVRAALLVQFLREHNVPLNIARTDLMRCNCAEDILDYGRGFKGAYQIARTAGAQADKQDARLEAATESLEGSLDSALVRAFALPGRGIAWLTIRQVLEIAGVRYTRPNALRAAEYLTKLYRVERKTSNRGKLYNMPARRGAGRAFIARRRPA